MSKKLFNLFLITLFVFGITLNVYAEDDYNSESSLEEESVETTLDFTRYDDGKYHVILEDDADLLTDDQEKMLKSEMTVLSEYGNVLFKTINSNPNSSAAYYAREYYHSFFGNYVSGVLFLIDMDTREIYLFMDGDIRNKIGDAKAYSITDNIYRYASNGDYYSCASGAFSQVKTLLEGRKIAEPMRNASNIVIAISMAFLINFLYVLSKSGIKKATNKEIVDNCNIDFKLGTVIGTQTGTHRVYSPQSDSSSGGSSGGGGGGGGGGGSSGGGGGHSF
ncbi:MAG: TPM domain-containing protein [Bacilli bacterium]|nr:TPM domain-containing protein [Bacilli bacterium]